LATTQTRVILNSWKEIASYLGRGVRTVQRYERENQLPVRRMQKSHGSVFALSKDVDTWLDRTRLHSLESDRTEDPTKWDALRNHQMAIKRLECSLQALNEKLAEGQRIRLRKQWFGAEDY